MDLGVLGPCRSKWRDESMKEWIICTYVYIYIYRQFIIWFINWLCTRWMNKWKCLKYINSMIYDRYDKLYDSTIYLYLSLNMYNWLYTVYIYIVLYVCIYIYTFYILYHSWPSASENSTRSCPSSKAMLWWPVNKVAIRFLRRPLPGGVFTRNRGHSKAMVGWPWPAWAVMKISNWIVLG